jgi:hypothetical protein
MTFNPDEAIEMERRHIREGEAGRQARKSREPTRFSWDFF